MSGRTDLMRQRYEAFNQGDVAGATQEWSEDIVWRGGASSDLPGGGEHRGKQAALAALGQAVGAWDSFSLTANDFYEDDDTVVVVGRNSFQKGDRSAEAPVVHIWTWDGDQIVSFQIVTDTHLTAQTLGAA